MYLGNSVYLWTTLYSYIPIEESTYLMKEPIGIPFPVPLFYPWEWLMCYTMPAHERRNRVRYSGTGRNKVRYTAQHRMVYVNLNRLPNSRQE